MDVRLRANSSSVCHCTQYVSVARIQGCRTTFGCNFSSVTNLLIKSLVVLTSSCVDLVLLRPNKKAIAVAALYRASDLLSHVPMVMVDAVHVVL